MVHSRTVLLLAIGLLIASTLVMPRLAFAQSAGGTQGADDVADDSQKPGLTSIELADPRGEAHRLSELDGAQLLVVTFIGTECPLARVYAARLVELANDYQGQPVTFLAVGSNVQDTLAKLQAYRARHGIEFAVWKDPAGRLADALKATRTPEVVLLDKQRIVRYRGQIDDQFGVGYAKPAANRTFLKDAIDQLLAGESVKVSSTPAVGCLIGRAPSPIEKATVTYAREVAPILNKHCAECHREGDIGPFELTTYEEASAWAGTIEEVIRDQRMPPWHADSDYGTFANARVMTAQEKHTIYQWVAEGTPRGVGEPVQPVTSEPKTPEVEFDRSFAMRARPFVVPADETVEYQYYVVDTGFTEDKWISAARVVPGNPSVVHHAIVFVRPPDGSDMNGIGWLSAYVPGQREVLLAEGLARRIPAGSKLIFQLHYTPSGSEQKDITRVDLKLADENQVKREVITMLAMNRQFQIPPFTANFVAHSTITRFPPGAELISLAPHMHVRGKSFHVELIDDDKTSTLLSVPQYDFNWQHAYFFRKPVPIQPGMQLRCTGVFDNSADNLVNPDPSATVFWGDQTWEEMLLGYVAISIPRSKARPSRNTAKAQALGRRFMQRWDADKDGYVDQYEVPEVIRTFAFRRMDADGDRRVTLEEATREALEGSR